MIRCSLAPAETGIFSRHVTYLAEQSAWHPKAYAPCRERAEAMVTCLSEARERAWALELFEVESRRFRDMVDDGILRRVVILGGGRAGTFFLYAAAQVSHEAAKVALWLVPGSERAFTFKVIPSANIPLSAEAVVRDVISPEERMVLWEVQA